MKISFSCDNEDVAKYFPPLPAEEMRPEWYKKLPFYFNGHKLDAKEMAMLELRHQSMTMKACVPVRDYMSQGYILRYPADIIVTPEQIDEEHGWWVQTAKTGVAKCTPHGYEQCPVHIKNRKNVYLKVEQPWVVRTPPGYSCFFYQPDFFFEDKIKLFPAVVDTDDFPAPINFPGVVLSDTTFTLNAGDPMMVVLPFKRESWEHEIGVAPKPTNPADAFLQLGYKKLFHKKKSYK